MLKKIKRLLKKFISKIVKEKSNRDKYHDMKQAIMARLTTKEKSTGSFFHSPSSSLVNLASTSGAIFPMIQLQNSEGEFVWDNLHGLYFY